MAFITKISNFGKAFRQSQIPTQKYLATIFLATTFYHNHINHHPLFIQPIKLQNHTNHLNSSSIAKTPHNIHKNLSTGKYTSWMHGTIPLKNSERQGFPPRLWGVSETSSFEAAAMINSKSIAKEIRDSMAPIGTFFLENRFQLSCKDEIIFSRLFIVYVMSDGGEWRNDILKAT